MLDLGLGTLVILQININMKRCQINDNIIFDIIVDIYTRYHSKLFTRNFKQKQNKLWSMIFI